MIIRSYEDFLLRTERYMEIGALLLLSKIQSSLYIECLAFTVLHFLRIDSSIDFKSTSSCNKNRFDQIGGINFFQTKQSK